MNIVKYPNIFFRSDDHLDHEFMIKGIPGQLTPRPQFSSVEEMNETLISRHNEVVRPGDLVYDLGDLFLKTTIERARAHFRRMNGQWFVIKGNHDQIATKMAKQDGVYSGNDFDINPSAIAEDMVKIEKAFVWYRSLEAINLGQPYFDEKQMIVLCHYAMRVWQNSHHGSWQLYGHSHSMLPELPELLSFDVGVDCWDFYPVSIEQVKEKMDKKMPAWLAYRESLRGLGRVE